MKLHSKNEQISKQLERKKERELLDSETSKHFKEIRAFVKNPLIFKDTQSNEEVLSSLKEVCQQSIHALLSIIFHNNLDSVK